MIYFHDHILMNVDLSLECDLQYIRFLFKYSVYHKNLKKMSMYKTHLPYLMIMWRSSIGLLFFVVDREAIEWNGILIYCLFKHLRFVCI